MMSRHFAFALMVFWACAWPAEGLAQAYEAIYCYPSLAEIKARIPNASAANMMVDRQRYRTPLMIAAQCGRYDAVAYMIELGADLYLNTGDSLAVERAEEETRELLRAAMQQVDSFSLALQEGQVATLERMARQAPFLLNSPDNSSLYPMHHAIARGDTALMRRLVDWGTRLDLPQSVSEPMPLLTYAAKEKQAAALRQLLEWGLRPASMRSERYWADGQYYVIYEMQDTALLRLFLEKGANPNHPYLNQVRPLGFAALRGRRDMVALLLAAGADPNQPNTYLVEGAASFGDLAFFQYVESLGVPVADANLCFREACKAGRMPLLRHLRSRYAIDVDAASSSSDTPLSIACQYGHYEAAAYLVKELKADVNKPGHAGYSALERAAVAGSLDIVRMLIAEGADTAHTSYGNNVLDMAIAFGHKDIEAYLRSLGIVPNKQ